ncbi:MAG: hypothetical protein D6826_02400 [Alphaproteobacteria bacterium]|nr:MAG: hypothetical protein D6826_02400 [Alphaproteobacteria bacterium]
MHPWSLLRMTGISATAALLLAGCAGVKGVVTDASQSLDNLFAAVDPAAPEQTADQPPAPTTQEAAEELYQKALAARGRGDAETAFALFKQAAEGGHAGATYELAQAYTDGTGVTRDPAAGDKWFRTAAERGEPRAQFVLGAAYYGGIGVARDYERAVQYLSQAAARGHAQAQYLLGEAYSNGRGVPKNATWAARWYGKAAEQGVSEAQYAFGIVQATGLGLPVNRTAGYGWLVLAARNGHEKADVVRRAIAARMNKKNIAKAEAWADAFRPRTEARFADTPTVMYVQQSLNALGFDAGPVDGRPGPRTRGAVMQYQKKTGLPDDGTISPTLIERLLADQGGES